MNLILLKLNILTQHSFSNNGKVWNGMINLVLKVIHRIYKVSLQPIQRLVNVLTIIPISIIDQDPSHKKPETYRKSRGVLTFYQITIVHDPIKGYEEKADRIRPIKGLQYVGSGKKSRKISDNKCKLCQHEYLQRLKIVWDTLKMISQLIAKGKKVNQLLNSLYNSHQEFSKSFQTYKSQLEALSQQNTYIKQSIQFILNQYYKKRKLGTKLRGLNADLLAEIEAKIYPLIQIQLNLFERRQKSKRLQERFELKIAEFQQQLIGEKSDI